MPENFRLVLDNFSEVFEILESWADETFYDFSTVNPIPGSTYVIGRQQLIDNPQKVRSMAESGQYQMIFGNSAEGAWTLESQLKQLRMNDLAKAGQLLLIAGAEMPPEYSTLVHEHFLPRILDYNETRQAQQHTQEIFDRINKPYKFLFLNGRGRPHRRYLLERLKQTSVLDQSLWTMLDSKPAPQSFYQLHDANGIDIFSTPAPIRHLPKEYEVDRYRDSVIDSVLIGRTMIKQELFKQEWGEIYLTPEPYIDTYFSLVTETISYESDYSFRTEKIAKPLAMGHPFIVAANRGFYRDLHNMGFKTFSDLIDESFDDIDDAQLRMDRIVEVVTDLCQQDLNTFVRGCENACKYNQQHLEEIRTQERKKFPDRFLEFCHTT